MRSRTWAPRTRPGPARQMADRDSPSCQRHAARRGRAGQGVHVPRGRPLPAQLRHAGRRTTPASACSSAPPTADAYLAGRDRQPALLAGQGRRRSTSKPCVATSSSCGPRPWPPTAPARSGGWTRRPSRQASEEQDDRRVVDAWEERILEFCCGRATVTIPIILDNAISMDVDRQDPAAMSRVARFLAAPAGNMSGPDRRTGPDNATTSGQERLVRLKSRLVRLKTAGPIAGNGAEPSEPAGGPTGPGGPTVLSTHIHAHRTHVMTRARPAVSRSGWPG